MKKLPTQGIRQSNLTNMLNEGKSFKVSVHHESMCSNKFDIYIKINNENFLLYNQRSEVRRFKSLDTFYGFCQKLGIDEITVNVDRNKDGLRPKKKKKHRI